MSDGTEAQENITVFCFFLGGGPKSPIQLEKIYTVLVEKSVNTQGFSYSLIYKFALNFLKINECLRIRNEKTKWYSRSILCISVDIFISLYQSKSSAFLSDIIYSSFITCIF